MSNLTIPTLADLGVTRHESKLTNGVRVVLFEIPHAPIYLTASILAGARFDPIGKDGRAHFTEHMLVAGTKAYPRKDELALSIERLGGQMSALTNLDILKLNFGIAEKADIGVLVGHLNEVLTMSLFSPEMIETERGSILKEIGEAKSKLANLAGRAWHELIYQDTILSRFVLGTEKTVAALTRDDLLDHVDNFIASDRMTLVVSGGISIDELVQALESGLKLPASKKAVAKITDQKLPVVRKEHIRIHHDEMSEMIYMAIGFRTESIYHADIPVLDFIAEVIGVGRSSLLIQILRYDNGLVYNVSMSSYKTLDAGEWSIHTSTSLEQLPETLRWIMNTLNVMKRVGLPPELMAAKKEQLVKSLRVKFQTGEAWVSRHAYSESIGLNGETVLDWTKKMLAVSREDIIRVAKKYFGNDNWYLVAAGNLTEKDIPEIKLD